MMISSGIDGPVENDTGERAGMATIGERESTEPMRFDHEPSCRHVRLGQEDLEGLGAHGHHERWDHEGAQGGGGAVRGHDGDVDHQKSDGDGAGSCAVGGDDAQVEGVQGSCQDDAVAKGRGLVEGLFRDDGDLGTSVRQNPSYLVGTSAMVALAIAAT